VLFKISTPKRIRLLSRSRKTTNKKSTCVKWCWIQRMKWNRSSKIWVSNVYTSSICFKTISIRVWGIQTFQIHRMWFWPKLKIFMPSRRRHWRRMRSLKTIPKAKAFWRLAIRILQHRECTTFQKSLNTWKRTRIRREKRVYRTWWSRSRTNILETWEHPRSNLCSARAERGIKNWSKQQVQQASCNLMALVPANSD